MVENTNRSCWDLKVVDLVSMLLYYGSTGTELLELIQNKQVESIQHKKRALQEYYSLYIFIPLGIQSLKVLL